jgi:hypothetical protein
MENFTWHNGKTFEFKTRTGEVLSTNKISETHVSSSGGGGYVDPQYGGQVAAAQVSSTVTINHEFWIKEEDGNERAVQLYGDIPLKVGQKVTLILCTLLGEEKGYYVVLYNHNAKKHWFIFSGEKLYNNFFPSKAGLYADHPVFLLFNVKFMAYIVGSLLAWYFINFYAGLAVLAWGIYRAFAAAKKQENSGKALDAHLEKMAKDLSVS